MLIDLGFIWDNFLQVLILLILVTVVKTGLNIAILRGLGLMWQRAFFVGVVLGQLGEFSFLLVAMGTANGVVGDNDNRLLVTTIALSLVISPLWLSTARRLGDLAGHPTQGLRPVVRHVYSQQKRAARVHRYLAKRRWRKYVPPATSPAQKK